MTGPEHYRQAERLIAQALMIADGFPSNAYAQTIAEAQVHATLALAAANLLPYDVGNDTGTDWYLGRSQP